ncbi:Uma2 family endonuclease [Herbidospora daliensis]|uniref:Uma2 family endonuclease n=1 Tax=Herbidospora daliensis TaxID=295585 RepID=UPI000A79A012|nr:Uma2 family endonuclease [Herbidospora daliensis]
MGAGHEDREHSFNHGPHGIADLDRMPRDARYELVNGWIVMSPWPGLRHDYVVKRLVRILDAAIEAVGADLYVNGPVDMYTVKGVRVPDIAVADWASVRQGLEDDERAHSPHSVKLVIEVISRNSGSERTDRYEKADEYAASGVQEYWIVDTLPSMNITRYSLATGYLTYHRRERVFAGAVFKSETPVPIEFDPAVLLEA